MVGLSSVCSVGVAVGWLCLRLRSKVTQSQQNKYQVLSVEIMTFQKMHAKETETGVASAYNQKPIHPESTRHCEYIRYCVARSGCQKSGFRI